MRLLPCPSCAHHVRAAEGECPFCGARLTTAAPSWFSIALLGLALVGCDPGKPEPAKSDQGKSKTEVQPEVQPEPTPEPTPEPENATTSTTSTSGATAEDTSSTSGEPGETGASVDDEPPTTDKPPATDKPPPMKPKYGAPRPAKKYGAPPSPGF